MGAQLAEAGQGAVRSARFGRLGDAVPALLILALLAALAYYVWPTPWRRIVLDGTKGPYAARENRFTGQVQFLVAVGWVDVQPRPQQP